VVRRSNVNEGGLGPHGAAAPQVVSCVHKIIKMYCIIEKGVTGYLWDSTYVFVMCGLEVWTLSKSDENTLAIRERKIMRKILGPVKEIGVWRIRTNQEFLDLSRELGIMTEVRDGRLR